ncbi:reverse transcriptase [Elysia marginata]|uniref:Reverse transcriptase n=1 Tax=Elysia marginata TaxID=1093978 RepID=A0AAV4GWD5_9GAST|nr:reverse transcriptase [Elysia marginata]
MKAPAGRDIPAPFQRMPLMEEPFQRVVVDLVGPLPFRKEKYEYVLTMIDVSTRWAEARPLRQTTADKPHCNEVSAESSYDDLRDSTSPQKALSSPFNEFPIIHQSDSPLIFTNDATACTIGVINETGDEPECELKTPPTIDEKSKVTINPMLDVKQAYEVNQILSEFTDVLTSLPGHTKTIQHEIHVNSDEIVKVKPYQLPFASQEFVKEEVLLNPR